MSNRGALLPEASLGYRVSLANRQLTRTLRARLEPVGVAPGQFGVLLVLYDVDGVTQAELCDRVQVEQPTMANTLARMARDGLIERHPDPQDRRRVLVGLTERARRLEEPMVAAARAVNAEAVTGLDVGQVGELMGMLSVVTDNLGAS